MPLSKQKYAIPGMRRRSNNSWPFGWEMQRPSPGLMPLARMWIGVPVMGIADGPTEVHKVTIAKQVLKQYEPYEGLWPRDYLPDRVAAAKARYAEYTEHQVGNL